MRHYETTYILRPNLGESLLTEIIDRTNAIITDDGGSIINIDRWGLKKLAYEIKKEAQGYYINLNYASPGNTINELERIFRIDDRVLRFLTIKLNDSVDETFIADEIERIAAEAMAEEEKASAEDAETVSEDDASPEEVKDTAQPAESTVDDDASPEEDEVAVEPAENTADDTSSDEKE